MGPVVTPRIRKCAIGILLSVAWLGAVWSVKTADAPHANDAQATSEITEIPASLVETSFSTRSEALVASGTRILLVPHHLVAAQQIASLLSSTPAPTRVLLLSPDHFSRGERAISFPKQGFSWKGRPIPTDPSLQRTLEQALQANARQSDAVFMREHGVRGLLPFLTTAWPNAQIIPLTVRNDAPAQALLDLASAIETHAMDDKTIVVITIDFSHDLPNYVADLHDLLAEDALRATDVHATDLVEIDSRPLFRVLNTLAASPNRPPLGNVRIHAHTNALRLMKAETTELGTSHFLASYSQGIAPQRRWTTTLIHDEHKPVTSKEDRFYAGFDRLTTSTIPFPTAFVRIEQATSTRWQVLPLKQVGTGWLPLNDRERAALPQATVTRWIDWAKTHLTK